MDGEKRPGKHPSLNIAVSVKKPKVTLLTGQQPHKVQCSKHKDPSSTDDNKAERTAPPDGVNLPDDRSDRVWFDDKDDTPTFEKEDHLSPKKSPTATATATPTLTPVSSQPAVEKSTGKSNDTKATRTNSAPGMGVANEAPEDKSMRVWFDGDYLDIQASSIKMKPILAQALASSQPPTPTPTPTGPPPPTPPPTPPVTPTIPPVLKLGLRSNYRKKQQETVFKRPTLLEDTEQIRSTSEMSTSEIERVGEDAPCPYSQHKHKQQQQQQLQQLQQLQRQGKREIDVQTDERSLPFSEKKLLIEQRIVIKPNESGVRARLEIEQGKGPFKQNWRTVSAVVGFPLVVLLLFILEWMYETLSRNTNGSCVLTLWQMYCSVVNRMCKKYGLMCSEYCTSGLQREMWKTSW